MSVLTDSAVALAPVVAPYPERLDALHESVAPGRLVASATGVVLASRNALPHAPDNGLARLGVAWTTVGEPDAPNGTASSTPISTLVSTSAADRERFVRGLFALRCGLLRDVLGQVMRWLDGRTAEGSTLLARQMIQGTCADVAVEIAECEAMCARLDGDSSESSTPEIRRLIGRRLTAAGRGLLDLLGAAGFLSDGPGGDLYLAELADNVYLHPGTENEHARVDHL